MNMQHRGEILNICKVFRSFKRNEVVLVVESLKIFGRNRTVGGTTSGGKGQVEQRAQFHLLKLQCTSKYLRVIPTRHTSDSYWTKYKENKSVSGVWPLTSEDVFPFNTRQNIGN